MSGMSAVESALGNEIILLRILSHLPLSTLKELRNTNKFWDQTVTHLLKIGGRLHLEFSTAFASKFWSDITKTFEIWEKYGIQNITLHAYSFQAKRGWRPELKVEALNQIQNAFESFGHFVNKLSFSMEIERAKEMEAFQMIFQNMPNLLSLELDLSIDEEFWENFHVQMTSVKELKLISLHILNSAQPQNHLKKLLQLLPNLRSFQTNESNNYSELLPLLLTNVVKLDQLKFSNLADTQTTSFLTKFPLPLKSLTISDCNWKDFDTKETVQYILNKHATNLKYLELGITHGVEELEVTLIIPQMLNLETLKLKVIGRWGKRTSFNFNFKFGKNEKDVVEYAEDFPKLRKLKVTQTSESFYGKSAPDKYAFGKLLQKFLPGKMGCSESLRNVNLFVLKEWKRSENLSWGRKFLEDFKTTFPHATLEHVNHLIDWVEFEKNKIS